MLVCLGECEEKGVREEKSTEPVEQTDVWTDADIQGEYLPRHEAHRLRRRTLTVVSVLQDTPGVVVTHGLRWWYNARREH